MASLKFKKARWSMDESGTWLSILVPHGDAVKFVGEMSDKEYTAELKEYRPKRSLDANAYFWVLCGKLSGKIGIPPTEIYRQLIREVGDNYNVLPIKNKATDAFIEIWESHGKGWICEVISDSKLPGFKNVIAYNGSSSYDKAQMSRLIELIVDDCKAQGIETMTPDELSALIERWG